MKQGPPLGSGIGNPPPMQTATPLPINPAVLAWARQESGYTVDRVAHRLSTREERVLAWERGEANPSLPQLQKLAHFFQRPLGLFFQPKPPSLTPLAAEYRRLPGVVAGRESPEMRLALRQMLTRREHMINLLGEMGEDVPEFRLQARLKEKPEEVAGRLRKALEIGVPTQIHWKDEWQALSAWRSAVERLGVLVFQFNKVDLEEARGISLLRFPLPVVGVNSRELPEPKSFTLLHELVHMMLTVGNEEVPALMEQRNNEQWASVEQFAETVTSHTLVPEGALVSVIKDEFLDPGSWGLLEVRRLARRFRLSPIAMATRLRASDFMTWPQYYAWKDAWDDFLKNLPRKMKGFAPPVDMAITRNGRPFVQLVLEAMNSNRITSVEASRYLDLKFEHFRKLHDKILMGLIHGPNHD